MGPHHLSLYPFPNCFAFISPFQIIHPFDFNLLPFLLVTVLALTSVVLFALSSVRPYGSQFLYPGIRLTAYFIYMIPFARYLFNKLTLTNYLIHFSFYCSCILCYRILKLTVLICYSVFKNRTIYISAITIYYCPYFQLLIFESLDSGFEAG